MTKFGKANGTSLLGYLFSLTIVLGILGSSFGLGAAQFRASVVKIDITPDKSEWLLGYGPRQSTGVHDHLFHRIVAMDDGTTQFYLISTDICLYSPSVYDQVKAEIEKQTGIKPIQIWWTVTHTHAAPELGPPGLGAVFMGERYEHDHNTEYSAWAEKKLIEGVKEAQAKLEPARLGVGWGMAMANINRRARDEEGEAFLGLNPDGPADRAIGLLRLEKADGSLLALVANYAMHGTVLGDTNKIISGDAPGIIADYVEEKLGAPMLYINGAAGNLAPIYTVYPDFESGHLSQFRVLVGDKIIAAYHLMGPTTSDVKLALGETTVETPRRAGLGWAKDLGKYSRTTSGGENLVLLPIRFLRINNDIAIWSAPVELFCEIAMNVRNLSPFPYTFYFGYSNGWLGYFPTKAEFPYGGYEPKTSPFTGQAEGDLTRAVVGYLQGQVR
ncbi:MAG: neutral/alkaline non-lysosomal ceramidase N-terminal domain-containing protein [Terriglobia bacterium]